MRLRSQQLITIEEDVDDLVVEGDQACDLRRLLQRVVVRPGDVRMKCVADSSRPVSRRDPLVRADRLRVAGLEMLEPDIRAIEVVTRRQPGFKKQHGALCLSEYYSCDLRSHMPMRA